MPVGRSPEYLNSLLLELTKLPRETEWIEFKENNAEPREIGEYISALANSATLAGKANAYLVWGVRNLDHSIVGTSFDPKATKVGNEDLENWLLKLLTPKVHFSFYDVRIDDRQVVILEIERTLRSPVQFSGVEFIRVGSYKKKLKDFQEHERSLWRLFDQIPFESGLAADHLTDQETLTLLDFPSYFDLIGRPLPESNRRILEALQADNLISSNAAGRWDITNLAAIVFAKKMDAFTSLKRKIVRVVQYRGEDRTDTIREVPGTKGYGSGFEGLIGFVRTLLPTSEIIKPALRGEVSVFPDLAIRELVANAIIYQDFAIPGAGPMIEIFSNRVESRTLALL